MNQLQKIYDDLMSLHNEKLRLELHPPFLIIKDLNQSERKELKTCPFHGQYTGEHCQKCIELVQPLHRGQPSEKEEHIKFVVLPYQCRVLCGCIGDHMKNCEKNQSYEQK